MMKSPVRILLLTLAMLFIVEPLQSVHGILLSKLELATVNTPDAPGLVSGEQQEGRASGILHAMKAPFKAIGRLFSRGKKDRNRLQRISEKDIKKFESVRGTRIDNSAPVTPASVAEKSTSSGDASARNHLERGRASLNFGNLNEAIAELSMAASLDPKLSEAHTLLGVAYDRKGLSDLARQSFEAALRDPNDEAMHLNNLGFLHYERGEYKEAVKYLKRAAKVASNDQRIWNNLGLAQAELGKFDDAYKSFARIAGDFIGRLNIAAWLESHGFRDRAARQLEKALALQPNSTEVSARLAALHEGRDRLEEPRKVSHPPAHIIGAVANAEEKKH